MRWLKRHSIRLKTFSTTSKPLSGPGVGGSNPLSPTILFFVRSGDIGYRTFRRHGLHFWPETVLQGLQGFFLRVTIAEIAAWGPNV